MKRTSITVETTVNAPIEKVWNTWTSPDHIVRWNNASDDWHTPSAKNDLRVGGQFVYHMAAKDGSTGFDFRGVYDSIKKHELIEYRIDDGRKVTIRFEAKGSETKVVETFEAEETNTIELQQGGWQAILNQFKKHVESI